MSYEFTSESVSEGHPDKIADLISDAIATKLINGKKYNRAAVETLVTTNRVVIAGEYKTDIEVSNEMIHRLVRNVVKEIGYEQEGFHWKHLDIQNYLHGQSSDIALGTDIFGAGDQGIMFGYATRTTSDYMPPTLSYSHQILRLLRDARKGGETWLGPDAKAQVTIRFSDAGDIEAITTIVCSTQHIEGIETETVRQRVKEIILLSPEIRQYINQDTQFLINPTGRFVIGGPDGDTGLTGRKIIVDTYGGAAPHGGGAFSGKDFTKVDRSAAYMARYIAKNVVDYMHDARECLVQLSYAIGVEQPTSLLILIDGKHSHSMETIIRSRVDLTPMGILERFSMHEMDLTVTTNYGHFGDKDVPWEKLDLF